MKILLYPITILFSIVLYIRHKLYDMGVFKSKSFGVPIICVGNLRVGGTGKTPLTDFLVKKLKNNYKIAILSRGYMRKTKGFFIVDNASTSYEVGDEPKLLKMLNDDVMVAVCEDRCKGVEMILKYDPDISLIILDDAFQHRAIKAKLNIILTEYKNLYVNDALLPIGTLRDLKDRAHKADVIVVTKCPADVKPIDLRLVYKELDIRPYQKLLFTHIHSHTPVSLFDNSPIAKVERVAVTTAIAMPDKFVDPLKSKYEIIDVFAFKDHYRYKKQDVIDIFKKIEDNDLMLWDAPLLCTAKDAVKILELGLDDDMLRRIYVVNISLEIIPYAQSMSETNFVSALKDRL
ncbi:MAG: tetraacyldisaccharide 4'-kinase [Rikenellaceae bacterium]